MCNCSSFKENCMTHARTHKHTHTGDKNGTCLWCQLDKMTLNENWRYCVQTAANKLDKFQTLNTTNVYILLRKIPLLYPH